MPALASLRVGDARAVEYADAFADLVVMHGALYHLIESADRKRALSEARRVLRPGGVLLAFAITRYAGAVIGIREGLIYDRDYRQVIRTDVETGRRTDPPDGIKALPSAFFHLPEELRSELEAAQFRCETVLGIIGPEWLVPDIDTAWGQPEKRECILEIARLLENEPVLGPRILDVGSGLG